MIHNRLQGPLYRGFNLQLFCRRTVGSRRGGTRVTYFKYAYPGMHKRTLVSSHQWPLNYYYLHHGGDKGYCPPTRSCTSNWSPRRWVLYCIYSCGTQLLISTRNVTLYLVCALGQRVDEQLTHPVFFALTSACTSIVYSRSVQYQGSTKPAAQNVCPQ